MLSRQLEAKPHPTRLPRGLPVLCQLPRALHLRQRAEPKARRNKGHGYVITMTIFFRRRVMVKSMVGSRVVVCIIVGAYTDGCPGG